MYIYSSQFFSKWKYLQYFWNVLCYSIFLRTFCCKNLFCESFVEYDVFFQIFYVNYHQIFSSKKIWNKNEQSLRILRKIKFEKNGFIDLAFSPNFLQSIFSMIFCSQIFRKKLSNFFEKMWRKKEKQKINEKHIF